MRSSGIPISMRNVHVYGIGYSQNTVHLHRRRTKAKCIVD